MIDSLNVNIFFLYAQRVDKIEEADHCVTTVPVDNCPEVLLFWRHFIDPVNQACGNIKGK